MIPLWFTMLMQKFSTRRTLGRGITIIIPYRRSKKIARQHENFKWTQWYWRLQLPGAQVLVGKDAAESRPFSKCAAVNHAARRATGDVLVIVDADCYVSVQAVLYCVAKIRAARMRGRRLWYVPYRQFYRLTDHASRKVLNSHPLHPWHFSTPPEWKCVQNTSGSGHGHWYGALVQIVPREAFDAVGGWDERFRGWGGEDHSIMRATDTLYWPHKTLPGQVLHLWHPVLSKDGLSGWVEPTERVWDNQAHAECNGPLAYKYSLANGDVERMRALVHEGRKK